MPNRRSTALSTTALLTILAGLPAAAIAQDDLRPGAVQQGSLQSEAVAIHTVQLDAETFVAGYADQLSVDVVVHIKNQVGEPIARFDEPATGPERFRFFATQTGTYTIEIEGFEGDTGDYTLTLSTVEPIATEPAGRVDQLMESYDNDQTPGAAVAVYQDGAVVFSGAYGMAELAHGHPWTVQTATNIGSTSKQFTAFAIGLLAQRGELSLDDEVRTHLPELPDFGTPITLRHMLNHTTGYREFLNLLAMGGRQVGTGDTITRDEIVDLVKRQPELQNQPGEEWNYNNTAFSLLTLVVERVSGTPFDQWMDENVFTPLGMDDTLVRADRGTIIPGRAAGYTMADGGVYVEAIDLGGSMGAGGMYSTVEDLGKWINNLHTGAIGGADLLEEMTTPTTLNNGEPTRYGLGLFISEVGGQTMIHHGGADTAHRSNLMYFPEFNGAIITQSNNAGFDGNMAQEIAKIFFSEHFEDPEAPESDEGSKTNGAPESDQTVPVAAYDALLGRYGFEEIPGFVLEITRTGDTLHGQATGQPRMPLTANPDGRFQIAGEAIYLEFLLEDDGTCPALTLHQNGQHRANRIEAEPWAPDAEALEAYAGRYFCEELETFYTLAVVDGELTIQHRRFGLTLKPGEEHEFAGDYPVAEVEFDVDSQGRVLALLASNGRTRDVKFTKLD